MMTRRRRRFEEVMIEEEELATFTVDTLILTFVKKMMTRRWMEEM